jgi:hypothetical protein
MTTIYSVTLPEDWTGPSPLTLRPRSGGVYTFERGESHVLTLPDEAAAAGIRASGFKVEPTTEVPVSENPLATPLVPLAAIEGEALAAEFERVVGKKAGNRTEETMRAEIAAHEEET